MLAKAEVLDYLGNCVYDPGSSFMVSNTATFTPRTASSSLFSDGQHWAIVFEKSGYANRGGRIELELNYFANCLHSLEVGGSCGR